MILLGLCTIAMLSLIFAGINKDIDLAGREILGTQSVALTSELDIPPWQHLLVTPRTIFRPAPRHIVSVADRVHSLQQWRLFLAIAITANALGILAVAWIAHRQRRAAKKHAAASFILPKQIASDQRNRPPLDLAA